MHDYHYLSVITGVGGALLFVLFVVFAAITTLDLRSHLVQQRHSAAAAGVASVSVLFGLPLSTLLRGVMVATTWTSVIGVVWVVVAPFLVVEKDVQLHMVWWLGKPSYPFSTSGRLCYAAAKLGTSLYMICKAWTYVFFWLKSRSVRPLESPTRGDKLVLSTTGVMFLIALVNCWNIRGVASVIDGTCLFRGDPWVAILVALVDVGLSATYLWMFVAPLRAIIRINQNMQSAAAGAGGTRGSIHARAASSQVGASTTAGGRSPAAAGSSASSAATAAAPSHDRVSSGRAMESLMRKHVVSVSFSTAATVFALGWVTMAHYLKSEVMAQIMWLIGATDLAITIGPMVQLMARGNTDRTRGPQSIVGSQNSVELQQQQRAGRRPHDRMNSIQSTAPGVVVAGAVAGQQEQQQQRGPHRLGTKQSSSKVMPAPPSPVAEGVYAPGTPSLQALTTPTHTAGTVSVAPPLSPAFASSLVFSSAAVSSDDVQPFSPTAEPRSLFTPSNVSPLIGASTPGGGNGGNGGSGGGGGGGSNVPALRYLSLPNSSPQAWAEPSMVSQSEERKDSKD